MLGGLWADACVMATSRRSVGDDHLRMQGAVLPAGVAVKREANAPIVNHEQTLLQKPHIPIHKTSRVSNLLSISIGASSYKYTQKYAGGTQQPNTT